MEISRPNFAINHKGDLSSMLTALGYYSNSNKTSSTLDGSQKLKSSNDMDFESKMKEILVLRSN